jgi:glycosyltransferase involved in cell wall biosynthesis
MSKEGYSVLVVCSPSPISGGGSLRAFRSLREYVKYFKTFLFIPWGLWSNRKDLQESMSYLRELGESGVKFAGFSQLPEVISKLGKVLGTRVFETLLSLMIPNITRFKIGVSNYDAVIALHEGWDAVYGGSVLAKFFNVPNMVLLHDPPFYGSKERFLNIMKAVFLSRILASSTTLERVLSKVESSILNISEYYLNKLRYEKLLRDYDVVIGVTKATAIEMGGEWLDKMIYFDPGVSLDEGDLEIIKNIRGKIKEKRDYVVFGGRPTAKKGLFEALISFKIISNHFSGIKLFITGKIPSRTLLRTRMVCRRLGIEDKVIFTGFLSREKRFEVVAKAKLMLYPSHVDAFSYAVLESLHLGTPVIAYRIPALEIYYGGTSGVELVDEWNLESFTVKAIDILEKGVEVIEPPKIKSWDEIMDEEVGIVQKLITTGKFI